MNSNHMYIHQLNNIYIYGNQNEESKTKVFYVSQNKNQNPVNAAEFLLKDHEGKALSNLQFSRQVFSQSIH